MNFSDFTIAFESSKLAQVELKQLSSFINTHTTPEVFSNKMALYPNFTLKTGTLHGRTVLAMAAMNGNIALINHIVEIGGKQLLHIGDETGKSPLHYACSCLDSEKGYNAAVELIRLGTPINIVKQFERKDSKGNTEIDFGDTPLECALRHACIKMTSLLLKQGGIFRPELFYNREQETLDAAKKL